MARIGLFGGSFNPVHTAHLILAERVREEAALDRVLFVPAGQPPHKPDVPLAPAEQRVRMLELAVADNPFFGVSTLEVRRPGPSYTLTTVRELRHELGERARLFLVVGADSILDMPRWWHADELVREVEILGVARPGFPLDDLSELEACFGGARVAEIRGSIVKAPLLAVSATEVRERVRRGLSIRYLVPEPVRQHILASGIYSKG